MAIITISRQVAARGDEVATILAQKIGYEFITRKKIGAKILELGFPGEKMKKYDEIKPGFFASLTKDRDEYLDYLQTAILEFAVKGNCIFIGRGSFIILRDLPNLVSVRLVTEDTIRLARLMAEFSWNEKQAQQRIDESDANRLAFHKSFFNLDNESYSHFHGIFNTGILSDDITADLIKSLTEKVITPENEAVGKIKVKEMYKAQKITNTISLEKKLPISFLHTAIEGDKIILSGVADATGIAEKAVSVVKEMMGDVTVETRISVVNNFNFYR